MFALNSLSVAAQFAVDLGLPSGTLWANKNIGAQYDYNPGNLYAWGETETKSYYNFNTYHLTELSGDIEGTEYDVVRKTLGAGWQMPSEADYKELLEYCSWIWYCPYGIVWGYRIVSKVNANEIFLPVVERVWDDHSVDSFDLGFGSYWTSTSNDQRTITTHFGETYDKGYRSAVQFYFNEMYRDWSNYDNRAYGCPVRGVYKTPVSSVTIEQSSIDMDIDETVTLTANVLPNNAVNKVVEWSSSDNSIATVSSEGIVTAIGSGVATITAKTVDGGFAANCDVKVDVLSSGTCGTNAKYYITNNHELIIYGTGAMVDYSANGPWYGNNITKVTIKDGITKIGRNSFNSETSLIEVSIPGTVKSIGSGVFAYCDKLSSIVVDKDNEMYDSRENCNAIIKSSDNTLVAGCTKTTIPNTVTNIGSGAFLNCTGLTNIIIPNGITTINKNAFLGCSKLTSLVIPKSVSSIGESAFYGCGLNSIVIPNSVTSIGSLAFSWCDKLSTVICEAEVPMNISTSSSIFSSGYISKSTLYVPSHSVDLYKSANCWRDFGNIVGFTTEQPVLSTSLTFSESLIELYVGDTKRLDYDIFPTDATVKNLSWTSSNNYIVSVDNGIITAVRSGIATITVKTMDGSNLSAQCQIKVLAPIKTGWCGGKAEYSIYENKTLVISGTGAMRNYDDDDDYAPWSGIKHVIVGKGMTSIGSYAFYERGIMSIELPNTLTSIGVSAFQDCDELESIVLPSGLKTISVKAFDGCCSLTSITIPCSVEYISNDAFGCCEGLNSINVKDGNEIYDSRDNCNAIIQTDGNILITGCKNTIIPNSVTRIGNSAFFWCSTLESIVIPNSVETIGHYAFSGCDLKQVTCEASNPPTLGSYVFDKSSISRATLLVPYESLSLYETAEGWKDFGTIKAFGEIELVDGEPYVNEVDKDVPLIRYTRTFSASSVGNWQALCVPFSINVEDYKEDFDIAELYAFCQFKDTNNDGVVTAEDEDQMIVSPLKSGNTLPNMPYVIRPKHTDIVIEAENATLYASNAGSVAFSTARKSFTITGILENSVTATADNKYHYVSGTGNISHKTSGSAAIKPNRWYMTIESRNYGGAPVAISSESKEIGIIAIGEDVDETTAIKLMSDEYLNFDDAVYNLNGMRVKATGKLPSGIYIKNGKKIFVK